MKTGQTALRRKDVDRPLSRFPLRGKAGAGGFPPRRKLRGSPHKRAPPPCASPVGIP
jgi:hypothetical protein